ncbi:hypothetical protein K458DRAFT_408994 [Lentithecium fluviatile CBS 122367]|uniref:Uncharacterized protein n=1 Tax=Lentithecium fluviatile CBS 122367 TaxID=1168545 RepID=A0A6G1IJH3_9PLEO|nr:hypothetical protein K458DRAFT_408994 [Lentithecium fluviatile CBS 122367]
MPSWSNEAIIALVTLVMTFVSSSILLWRWAKEDRRIQPTARGMLIYRKIPEECPKLHGRRRDRHESVRPATHARSSRFHHTNTGDNWRLPTLKRPAAPAPFGQNALQYAI